MFQRLCSTSTWKSLGLIPNNSKLSFHVFQSFMLNTNVSKLMCSEASHSTQNVSSTMFFRVHAQHKQTHIYHMQLPYAEYIKQSSCSYAVESLTQYIKIKYQGNIIINALMPISVRSKIQDITSIPAQNNRVPGVLGTHNEIMKQGRVSLSHGGFILPSSLLRTLHALYKSVV